MCKCTPNKRTPWCGKPGCEMPEQTNKCPECGGLPGLYPERRCPVCHFKHELSTNPTPPEALAGEMELDASLKDLQANVDALLMKHATGAETGYTIQRVMQLIAAQKAKWLCSEREAALSDLSADNEIQKRDFDLPRDFLDGWQDAIDTAARQRDERIQHLTSIGQGDDNA